MAASSRAIPNCLLEELDDEGVPAAASNRGRKTTAMTAVTPGSRPTTSNRPPTGGLLTAGVSAVGRKRMADLQHYLVRARQVERPEPVRTISRSAQINVLVCSVNSAGAADSRFRSEAMKLHTPNSAVERNCDRPL